MNQWTPSERAFSGTSRYAVVRKIGVGGMGVVYEAEDLESKRAVAIKTLHRFEPDAVYRIKKEFRALDRLRHPNLVDRHALVEHDGAWFIVMELVNGVDIVRSVRQVLDPAVRQAHLRECFSQLAQAVAALHGHEKLHRDLKPSNVLVTDVGRTVLLDFGLVSAVGEEYFVRSTMEGRISGTAAYMSPEQAAGERVDYRTDLYGLGAMLFEALVGRLPFVGSIVEVLMAKQREDAPLPQSIDPAAPADLSGLCTALLRRHPEDRPSLQQIIRILGAGEGLEAPTIQTQPAPEEALSEAFAAWNEAKFSAGRMVWVEGGEATESAALLRALAKRVGASQERLVFSARARTSEEVPFPGLDELMDGLARWLTLLPDGEVQRMLPDDIGALVQLFPVLGRQEILRRASSKGPTNGPAHVRGKAALALRELLKSASLHAPILILIDDLQHADVDTAELLYEVFAPGIPDSTLVVLAGRPVGAAPFFGALWRALAEAPVSVHLSRLELTPSVHVEEDATVAAPEARQTSSRLRGLDELLFGSLGQLDPVSYRLLRSVALSGRTLPGALALATVPEASMQTLVDLVQERLLEAVADPGALTDSEAATSTDFVHWVQTADEHVNQAVLAKLPDEVRLVLHGTWAEVLAERGDLAEAAKHLRAAGAEARAHELAYKAADKAFKQNAYGRAAELFRLAAELAPAGHRVRWQCTAWRAEALASAGRHEESAEDFEQAARDAGDHRNFELVRRAGAQWFAAGNVERAQVVLHPLCQRVGLDLPASTREAMKKLPWALLRARLKGGRWISPSDLDKETRQELDLAWTLCSGLSFFAPARALFYASEYLRRVLGRGDAFRVARALGCDIVLNAGRDGRQPNDKLVDLRDATAAAGTPHATALRALTVGMKEHLETNWVDAVSHVQQAIAGFAALGPEASWEKVAAQRVMVEVCCYLGRHRELKHALRSGSGLLGRSQDSPMLRVSRIAAWRHLYADRVGAAFEEARYCTDLVERGAYPSLKWAAVAIEVDALMYQGRIQGAHDRLQEGWPDYVASRLDHLRMISVETWFLKLRLELAVGTLDRTTLAAALKPLKGLLHANAAPQGAGYFAMLQALAFRAESNVEEELRHLIQATACFAKANMEFHAAVAARRTAELQGVSTNLVDEWFEVEQYPNPQRLQDWLHPFVTKRA